MNIANAIGLMAATSACLIAATPALSQDVTVYGGAAVVYSMQLDNAAGDNTLAFQPYVEAEVNGLYAGFWLSLNSDSVATEVDIYLGYRNETASGMAYDLAYTRYFYPNAGGNCCGELSLELNAPAGDVLTLNINAALDPQNSTGSVSVGGDYAIGDKFSLGAAIGLADFNGAQEWELGASYQLTEQAAVDLTYYDGSDYTGYVELKLSFDTTLLNR